MAPHQLALRASVISMYKELDSVHRRRDGHFYFTTETGTQSSVRIGVQKWVLSVSAALYTGFLLASLPLVEVSEVVQTIGKLKLACGQHLAALFDMEAHIVSSAVHGSVRYTQEQASALQPQNIEQQVGEAKLVS